MTDRRFNGKIYKEYGFSTTKPAAEAICKQIRLNGSLARIIKTKNGYIIYARKG